MAGRLSIKKPPGGGEPLPGGSRAGANDVTLEIKPQATFSLLLRDFSKGGRARRPGPAASPAVAHVLLDAN